MLKSDEEFVDWGKTRQMRQMIEKGGFSVDTGRPFRSEVDKGHTLSPSQIKAFNRIFKAIAKEIHESKFAEAYRDGVVQASVNFQVGSTTKLLVGAYFPRYASRDVPVIEGAWEIGKRGKITPISSEYIPDLNTSDWSSNPIEQGMGWSFPSGYFR